MKNVVQQRAGLVRGVRGDPQGPGEPAALVATYDPQGVTLRPPRVRDPEASIYVTWGQIYHRALVDRARLKVAT